MRKQTIDLVKRGVAQCFVSVTLIVIVHSQAHADAWVAELGIVHWSYKEPSLAVTHEGWLPSFGISKKLNQAQEAVGQWDLSATLAIGQVDYSGTGTMKGQPMAHTQAMAAYLIPLENSNAQWAPTLAYDHVFNDGRGVTSTGQGGYRRVNQRLSAGLQWRQPMANGWHWRTEIQRLLRGRQTSELSDIGGEYQGLTAPVNVQRNGWALKLDACKDVPVGQICLQAQHTRVGASDRVLITTTQSRYEVHEPANNYMRLGVTFKRPLQLE